MSELAEIAAEFLTASATFPREIEGPHDKLAESDLAVLSSLAAVLRRHATFASIERKMRCTSSGPGVADLEEIARGLLRQILAGTDALQTMINAEYVIRANRAPMLTILCVRGIRVESATTVMENVQIVPMDDLPPSAARTAALQRETRIPHKTFKPMALVRTSWCEPVFFDQSDSETFKLYERETCFSDLREMCKCLTLANLSPPFPCLMWRHFVGEGSFLQDRGSYYGASPLPAIPLANKPVDGDRARHVCNIYFGLPKQFREERFNIPLQRLSTAIRERLPSDKAIDLGIALEALLLYREQVPEIALRLCLRAAWLLGDSVEKRTEIFHLMKELYEIRSKAAHGVILTGAEPLIKKRKKARSVEDTTRILDEGLQLCSDLILRVMEKGEADVKWEALILGK